MLALLHAAEFATSRLRSFESTKTCAGSLQRFFHRACRQSSAEEQAAQQHRNESDLPLAIAADAAATRYRTKHWRAARAYQRSAEAYDASVRDWVENAAEARSRQHLADRLGAESLRRDAAAAAAGAMQAVRKQRKLQQQLGRAHASIAALLARRAAAENQARQLTERADTTRREGHFMQAEQYAQLAGTQQSRAAHVAAQALAGESQAEQLRADLKAGADQIAALVQTVRDKEQLRRNLALAGLASAAAEASAAATAAQQRAAHYMADAEAASSDAAQLRTRIRSVGDGCRGAELMLGRASALEEDAEARRQAAACAEADADALAQHAEGLQAERSAMERSLAASGLVPDALTAALEGGGGCEPPASDEGDAIASRDALRAEVDVSCAACDTAVTDTQRRVALLQQERVSRISRMRLAEEAAHSAKADLAGSEASADNEQTPARERAAAAASANVARVHVNAAEHELSCCQRAVVEWEAHITEAQRQADAGTARGRSLRNFLHQMDAAWAAADAARPSRRRGPNIHAAISDISIELDHFHAELRGTADAQQAALERAFEAVDDGDGAQAADAVAEVRSLAARRLELQESAAELQADLQCLQDMGPSTDALVRTCSEANLTQMSRART